jgi:hypothetical protein
MSEGHPKDIKSNWKGINHNTEREISGAGDTGEYLDGKNGRITSKRGNNMSFEKIRGEEFGVRKSYILTITLELGCVVVL